MLTKQKIVGRSYKHVRFVPQEYSNRNNKGSSTCLSNRNILGFLFQMLPDGLVEVTHGGFVHVLWEDQFQGVVDGEFGFVVWIVQFILLQVVVETFVDFALTGGGSQIVNWLLHKLTHTRSQNALLFGERAADILLAATGATFLLLHVLGFRQGVDIGEGLIQPFLVLIDGLHRLAEDLDDILDLTAIFVGFGDLGDDVFACATNWVLLGGAGGWCGFRDRGHY